MLDPSASFIRFARPARLQTWKRVAFWAVMIWPITALAEDPNQAVTTGIPIVDVILKVLGAIYVLLSALLLVLPKTSKVALALASVVADLKGIVPQAAAVKEATTGAMAIKLKRESTIPPPRGFTEIDLLVSLGVFSLLLMVALGIVASGCKTNPARTACDIVHIIDDGCQTFVQVPLPDGTVERVPRAEIVRLASATKAARVSAADAGAP